MNEIRQKQQDEKNPKSTPTKSKANSKPSSQNKQPKRKCTLLLRGSSIVKKVLLEKVSCSKNQKRPLSVNLNSETQDYEGADFEFISTPFNEEIPPIKIAKLEKYFTTTLKKDQTPVQSQPPVQASVQMPGRLMAPMQARTQQAPVQPNIQAAPFMKPQPMQAWEDMYYSYLQKNMMRMPMDPQKFPLQDKPPVWMGQFPLVRDNMNMAMNPALNMNMGMAMFPQPPVMMTKPPQNHNQTIFDLS